MYGKLQNIDISSILQLIELRQGSGVLLVETEVHTIEDNNIYLLFFLLGKIIYVADNQSFNLIRLHEYLRYYKLDDSFNELSMQLISLGNIPEYETILVLLQKQIISSNQARLIIEKIIDEILFNVLPLKTGTFNWEPNYNLQPQIVNLEINPLLQKINYQLQLWQQFYPYIKSPHQCPVIEDEVRLSAALTKNAYFNLTNLMDGKTSFRQLSRYLNKDLITITKAIYPCLEVGWVSLFKESNEENSAPEKFILNSPIACITKDINWVSNLKIVLKQNNYDLLVINKPNQILNLIFENLPSLILWEMETNSPNNYEFCRMLREYKKLANTPLIFIANQYILSEELRYKIAGATEYLSKSVFTKNLMIFIEKYIQK